jgi:hypothetical protein
MKDDDKKKKIEPGNKQDKKVKKINPKHQEEQEKLFSEADQISPVSKKIDKAEIVKTIGGEVINVADYVEDNYVTGKSTHYFKPFYNAIADLLGLSHDVMKPFRKLRIVALLKRKFVWGRFPNTVQQKIYKRNPYTGYCTRTYWNYQVITKKADTLSREYIKDFEETAKKVLENNGRMKEFIIEHSTKCGLPIQLEFFESMGDR